MSIRVFLYLDERVHLMFLCTFTARLQAGVVFGVLLGFILTTTTFLQNRLQDQQPQPAAGSSFQWFQGLSTPHPENYTRDQGQEHTQKPHLNGINSAFVYADKIESDKQLQGNSNMKQVSQGKQNEEEYLDRAEARDVISVRNHPQPNEKNIDREWLKAMHAEGCKTVTRNVYYVKVHKTGSSTFVTLLYNFARRHNLTMYPITAGTNKRGKNIISQRFVPPKEHKDVVFNIFGEHAWFNETIATWVMPRNTTYIASIRYPYSQMRSYFNELKLDKKMGFHSSDPVEEFLRASDKHGTPDCCTFWRHGISVKAFGGDSTDESTFP